MKLKALFNRMKESWEIKSNKDRIPEYCCSAKNKRKSKTKLGEFIEFNRYLDELRKKTK